MDFNRLKDKFKNKFKLDKIIDKLFSGKINKKELKQNFLLNISLLIRHFIITNKKLVSIISFGLIALIILSFVYIHSYEIKVNEANRWFEIALSFYRKAFIEKDLAPDERGKAINESIKRFQHVIQNYGNTPLKYDAMMYQANAFFELGNYNNALKKYQEIIDKKSRFYFADFILINIAKCHEQLNNIQGAVSSYQAIIDDYSDGPAVVEAKFYLARIKELTRRGKEAVQDYQNLIRDHPQSIWRREATQRILFLQALSGGAGPQQTKQPSPPKPQKSQQPQPQQGNIIEQLLKEQPSLPSK